MIRRFAGSLALALSTIALVAAVGLGVRSFFTGTKVYFAKPVKEDRVFRYWRLLSTNGCVVLEYNRRDDEPRRTDRYTLQMRPIPDPSFGAWRVARRDHGWYGLGMGFERVETATGDTAVLVVCIPYWLLCIIFAILPARRAYLAWRGRRRRRKGLCLQCGYDLRASPSICPECGRSVDRTAPGR